MNFQTIVVFVILLVAVFFAASMLIKKRRSFSARTDCGDDCGCGKK